ncbi:MAG: amidohydrolase family protein, partial [Desulfobacterales bacterium]|nr:amidohydrolase family protein [Desulfobacterales bacterium]
HGRVITADGEFRGSVYIESGKIAGLGDLDLRAQHSVDASGLLVMPGMFESHAHMMDPAETGREEMPIGTAAAAAQGVTALIEHSHCTAVHSGSEFRNKRDYLKNRSMVDFGIGAHFPTESIDHVGEAVQEGAAFIKVMTCTTHGIKGVTTGDLHEAMSRYGKTDIPFLIHAEDEGLTTAAERQLRAASRQDGGIIPEWRSRLAETMAAQNVAAIAEATRALTVLAHCSHPEIFGIARAARQRGARVWTEACPQYFALKEDEVSTYGALRKFTPPNRIRSDDDVDALWACIGEYAYFASDHAPSTLAQKRGGSIWEAPFGLPGVDTTFRFLLDAAAKGRISYPMLVDLYSRRPAMLYGYYPRKGTLAPGSDGDIVLVDPDAEYEM